MDKMEDSGSFDKGSIPFGGTTDRSPGVFLHQATCFLLVDGLMQSKCLRPKINGVKD